MVETGVTDDPGADAERPYRRERSVAIKAAHAAGAAIRDVYGQVLEVSYKEGDDPLTIADQAADRIILERIRAAFPDDGWLSEEDSLAPTAEVVSRTWVVDPLDGTREFVKGIPEFAVSIALLEEGRPVVAVVYNPIADLLVAATRGGGVSGGPRPETTRHATDLRQALVLASRSEVSRGQWAPFEGTFEIEPTGSIAYKLALVAFGMADATISLAPKHGWDVCAGVLLVEEAGGRVSTLHGEPLDLSRPAALLDGLIASQEPLFPALVSVVAAAGDGQDQRGPDAAELLVAASLLQPTLTEDQASDAPSASEPEQPAWAPGPTAPPAWPDADETGYVAPRPTLEPSARPDEPPRQAAGVVPTVGPRITRPAPFATPFVVASPAPLPADHRRPLIRAAVLYAVIICIGVLIGFILADATREAREGGSASPAATASAAGLSALPPVGLEVTPGPVASGAPSPTLTQIAGPAMAPPVAALGERLTAKGIELELAWQPPVDGGRVSSYDLRASRDGGADRTVDLAKKTSRRATVAADADHDYAFRLRARDSDGTPGAYVDAVVRLSEIEESAPEIRASKGWKLAKHPEYTGDGAVYATAPGAELSMAFAGTGVALVGPTGPGRGRADVFVDGERVGRLDAAADAFRPVYLLFSVDGLAAGPHVMTVRVAGTEGRPMVAIDRFLVLSQS